MSTKAVALLLFAFILSSCQRTTYCEGFNPAYQSWIQYRHNDTVRFKNDNNDRIYFIMGPPTIDLPYESDDDDCATPLSMISGNSPSSRNGTNILKVVALDYRPYKIVYNIFDYLTTFKIDLNTMTPDDTSSAQILDSVTLGGTTYMNVYCGYQDTLTSLHPLLVWKTYYNKQYGILGFHDRQTHSLFYRE